MVKKYKPLTNDDMFGDPDSDGDEDTSTPDKTPTLEHSFGSELITIAQNTAYELEDFIPVQEASDDKKTTESDLALLNNLLAMLNGALPNIRTLDSLIDINAAVNKTIETRRKVKKLQYGASNSKGGPGSTFEVIE